MTDKKVIDFKQVERMFKIHCTVKEVCAVIGVNPGTLEARLREVHGIGIQEFADIHMSHGKMSLRRKQYQNAMKGNNQMLIWLGKQNLGQRDKSEITGRDGERMSVGLSLNLSNLSTSELKSLLALADKVQMKDSADSDSGDHAS